ncbi:MAG: divergent PAP2 family protein [Oscillospiraceae bacterium]|nr:divergent PAP2 family protein [Oscillospiraceae bacterium]
MRQDELNTVVWFTGNHILNVSLCTFIFAQLLKVAIELLQYRKIDFRRLLGAGGMPSAHTATVAALATSVAKVYGVSSAGFAISAIFAFIVMYDASNVRRAVGEQAKILNYMMEHWNETTPEVFSRQLKELLGHTPLQVFAGAALGLAIGLIM